MLFSKVSLTFFSSLTLAALYLNDTTPYTTLSLPAPLNWKPKVDAGGGSVIETLYKPYEQYNASGWARFVLAECESYGGGTCVGYSELTTGAYNTEQPYRIWWGIVYDEGAKLSLDDFRRDISENDQIQDTVAFVTRDAAAAGPTSASLASSVISGVVSTTPMAVTPTSLSSATTAISSVVTSASGSSTISAAAAMSSSGAGGRTQAGEYVRFGLGLLMAVALV